MLIFIWFFAPFNFQISFKNSLHNIWNYILVNLMLEKKRFIVTHFRSKDVTMDTSYIYSNFWQWKLIEINLLFERGFAFHILSAMKAFLWSILFFLVGVILIIIKLFSINAEFFQNKQVAMPKILEIYLTLLLTTCTKAWWCSVPK